MLLDSLEHLNSNCLLPIGGNIYIGGSMTVAAELAREEYTNLNNQQALELIKTKTIASYSTVSNVEINKILVELGLLTLIEDQKNNVGDNSSLRNICLAIHVWVNGDSDVDLGNDSTVALINLFLAEPSVKDILSVAKTNPEKVKSDIMALGYTKKVEFPNIRMVDIIRVRG